MGDGASAFLSLCQGEKNTEKAGKAIGATLGLTFVVGVVFTVICLVWIDPILVLMGATEDFAWPFAREYGLIVMAGVIFSFYTNVLNPIIRSDGSPIFAMIAQGAGAVANIILDPVFIFVFNTGLAGAAYATIIGQALSTALSVGYLCKSKTFHVNFRSLFTGWNLLGKTLRLGISSFFIQMSLVFVTVVSNWVWPRKVPQRFMAPTSPSRSLALPIRCSRLWSISPSASLWVGFRSSVTTTAQRITPAAKRPITSS
jgi:Na+-driven multidrug efflux pump